jgi:hypothetical protein
MLRILFGLFYDTVPISNVTYHRRENKRASINYELGKYDVKGVGRELSVCNFSKPFILSE